MSCLLYCVSREGLRRGPDVPLGVQSQPVVAVFEDGLIAIVSEIQDADLLPDVETILAYEKVIEYQFEQATVAPMRYGCFLPGLPEAGALLRQRRAEYDALLRQLEGFAEMSVQVLNDESSEKSVWPQLVPGNRAHHADMSGSEYLLGRRLHYHAAECLAGQQNAAIESLCAMLSGTYARRKVEAVGSQFSSVHFLVPRVLVQHFRDVTREYRRVGHARILTSGPWPPFNFADSTAGLMFQ